MTIHRLAGVGVVHAVGSPLTKTAGDDIECFRARMGVHGCLGTGRSRAVVDAQQILWRGYLGDGADLCNPAPAGRRAALCAEREQPDLAGNIRNQEDCRCADDVSLLHSRSCLSPDDGDGRANPHGTVRQSPRGAKTMSSAAQTGFQKSLP
jgi:hypothetical protein